MGKANLFEHLGFLNLILLEIIELGRKCLTLQYEPLSLFESMSDHFRCLTFSAMESFHKG